MQTVVIKIGGATMDQAGMLEELANDLRRLDRLSPIVVHGGGAEISRYLKLLGKESTSVKGLRVTDADMVDIVEMVLSGKINKAVTALFQRCGLRAIGVSGKDLGLLRAEKLYQDGMDIGFVGKVVAVDTTLFDLCLAHRIIPVVSPISYGADGATYNVNADRAALEVAKAVACDDVVFISDVAGLHRASGDTIRRLTPALTAQLIANGEITGGMIPKVTSAVECVQGGAKRARIIAWNGPGTLLDELATPESRYGTVVTVE